MTTDLETSSAVALRAKIADLEAEMRKAGAQELIRKIGRPSAMKKMENELIDFSCDLSRFLPDHKS